MQIARTVDGDTLELTNGEFIRLIGVNTPERAHDGTPEEPLAEAASRILRTLVEQQENRLQMVPGVEHRDRHGRLLAHLFTEDGSNISALLLERGMGFAVHFPPNLTYLACYGQAERRARLASRGVWSTDYFRPRASSRLRPEDVGFRRVAGMISALSTQPPGMEISLEGNLRIWIGRDHLNQFPHPPNRDWIGRRVVVRGWLTKRGEHYRIQVRHTQDFELIDKI